MIAIYYPMAATICLPGKVVGLQNGIGAAVSLLRIPAAWTVHVRGNSAGTDRTHDGKHHDYEERKASSHQADT